MKKIISFILLILAISGVLNKTQAQKGFNYIDSTKVIPTPSYDNDEIKIVYYNKRINLMRLMISTHYSVFQIPPNTFSSHSIIFRAN